MTFSRPSTLTEQHLAIITDVVTKHCEQRRAQIQQTSNLFLSDVADAVQEINHKLRKRVAGSAAKYNVQCDMSFQSRGFNRDRIHIDPALINTQVRVKCDAQQLLPIGWQDLSWALAQPHIQELQSSEHAVTSIQLVLTGNSYFRSESASNGFYFEATRTRTGTLQFSPSSGTRSYAYRYRAKNREIHITSIARVINTIENLCDKVDDRQAEAERSARIQSNKSSLLPQLQKWLDDVVGVGKHVAPADNVYPRKSVENYYLILTNGYRIAIKVSPESIQSGTLQKVYLGESSIQHLDAEKFLRHIAAVDTFLPTPQHT